MRVRTFLSAFFLTCFVAAPAAGSDEAYGGIRLLEGYKYRKGYTVDALIGSISKEGGLLIEFEAGLSQGYAADPKDKGKYLWYREQAVNGRKVMLALIKPGLKTVWEPEKPRSRELGNILLITFPLDGQPDHAVNFRAEVLNAQEVADVLLMVLTFDASKS